MKRLTIAVDDIATLRHVLNDSDVDPVQFAILCEVAGANGISLTLADSHNGVPERDAHFIKKLHKTFLNIHIPPEPHLIKSVLSISPDMVTFVDISNRDGFKMSPLSASILAETLPDVLPDFQANNISVAVFSYPEISALKNLSRVNIDYVEFDCSEITMATDSNEELVAYDKLTSATLAAAKLGIGVNCYGGIDYAHLPGLAVIPRLEDICMGLSIIKRALLIGVEKAIREAREQIYFHQRESSL